jgi:hypothetical protein
MDAGEGKDCIPWAVTDGQQKKNEEMEFVWR